MEGIFISGFFYRLKHLLVLSYLRHAVIHNRAIIQLVVLPL